ncbi:MAG: glycoside hydrolase family 97 C-terminal domain-containing protein, partial [Candidatus Cryptobacteroides sp.]
NSQARSLSINLDFLAPGVTYKATIYEDDSNAEVICQPDGTNAKDKTAYRIREINVTSKDSIEISMAEDGGTAISFIPTI